MATIDPQKFIPKMPLTPAHCNSLRTQCITLTEPSVSAKLCSHLPTSFSARLYVSYPLPGSSSLSNPNTVVLHTPPRTQQKPTRCPSLATARAVHPKYGRISKICHPCGIHYASYPKAVIVIGHFLIKTDVRASSLLEVGVRWDCRFGVGRVSVFGRGKCE